ncbi:MAG: PAS domain S-box protein [Sulfurimonas sp.]|uniref:SpoIIE family protein phosphatase n=1 Tax=Sulfurimonas sp. TaxID=2022749 RepID=UPI0025E57923|nr:PAS domain S-box protein [Sulfurimonas sp.]MCK9492630.1 PAS domain S-box protein [Sulfurimonas sp.]
MQTDESNILKQYRQIVDESNIVSKSDLLGTITYANDKFVEVSGYPLEELLGRPHSILRNPDTPKEFFKELWETIQAKKIWRGVVTNRKKDGTFYIVNAYIYPILSKDGDILEYISIRHDITELRELNTKVQNLLEYGNSQQYIARNKLQSGIVNEFESDRCKVIYHPSDILSGDFYSIFKREDGSTFIYLLDGQGHGVSPALTVFATSATIKEMIKGKQSLKKMCKKIFPIIKSFLGDLEQLSYTMILINPRSTKLSYVSGGMYPFKVKFDDNVYGVKANNLPFMNFSKTPKPSKLNISKWQSMIIHSDGVVEHSYKDQEQFKPKEIIENPALIDSITNSLNDYKFNDDFTLIHLKNAT